jgi:hypothetical protein
VPVPTRRGGCISLDFLELQPARSGHDFLLAHIDLLTGRVLLVPNFKIATSATAAGISSVFSNVGLPDLLVSDRDTRFASAFLAPSTLRVPSPPQHHEQGRAR